jgi:addiction module RelE/StbE family toxin
MIAIEYHKGFLKDFAKLPKSIQVKIGNLEDVFKENPFHPQLHTKGLHGKLRDLYSFRITRDYRVVFQFLSENEVLLIAVQHRKDIYKK